MRREDFNYTLPPHLIANYPAEDRTSSRLLSMRRESGTLQHNIFSELIDYLAPNDCLILNNTKVLPARLYGHKASGGKVEMLVQKILGQQLVIAQIKASKAPKPGTFIVLQNAVQVEVMGRQNDAYRLKFRTSKNIVSLLHDIGHVPLPPYIKRSDTQTDMTRYQTVYAEKIGAVAAPTAGLHFDKALLTKIQNKGIKIGYVTLHVGAGTYLPIRVSDLTAHKMHSEWIEVSQECCDLIQQTKIQQGRVIAVGTTSVRALESAKNNAYSGETDIFIYPGYQFQIVDAMITNFHLPESSLIMLISAFTSVQKIMHAYQYAITHKYRFYSYGDAMFIY